MRREKIDTSNLSINNTGKLLAQLWAAIDGLHRKRIKLYLYLLLVSGLVEVISIASVLPLTGLLSGGQIQNNIVLEFYRSLSGNTGYSMVTIAALNFIAFVIFAAALKILVLSFGSSISFGIGAVLSSKCFELKLSQPYLSIIETNTGEIIDTVSSKTNMVVFGIIVPIFNAISAAVLLLVTLIGLLLVKPVAMIVCIVFFSTVYFLLAILTNDKLKRYSDEIAESSTKSIVKIQEAFGGIRDVIINDTSEVHKSGFEKSIFSLRSKQEKSYVTGQYPRYLIEAFGLAFISIYANIRLSFGEASEDIVPTLALLGLAAQRVLPYIQNIYGAWASIQSTTTPLKDVVAYLILPEPSHKIDHYDNDILFENEIFFKNLNYKYPQRNACTINCLNGVINRGDRCVIVGRSGVGKSTLVDLISGLLFPSSGHLVVDKTILKQSNLTSWRKNISHVSQDTYLNDSSILNNVVLGSSEVPFDQRRLDLAFYISASDEFISGLPNRFETQIGEGGYSLSGGQRQRLGIARGVYKKSSILILDEATSALDVETESVIYSRLKECLNDVTIIVISHRPVPFGFFNKSIKFEKGGLIEIKDID